MRLAGARAAGELGPVKSRGLDAAAVSARTILYVGTLKGFPAGPSAFGHPTADFVPGGVYQQTIVRRVPAKIYLPLVLRDH